MNRRLRKKKRIGEFRELGFEVMYRLPDELSSEQGDAFLCEFLDQAIELHELAAGGGGGNPWNFFVVSARHRRSATDLQCEAIKRWLSPRPEVIASEVGPLRDAWYGWD